MEINRILELAHDAAVHHWDHFREQLEKEPNSQIKKHREQEAWKEMKELELITLSWKEKEI